MIKSDNSYLLKYVSQGIELNLQNEFDELKSYALEKDELDTNESKNEKLGFQLRTVKTKGDQTIILDISGEIKGTEKNMGCSGNQMLMLACEYQKEMSVRYPGAKTEAVIFYYPLDTANHAENISHENKVFVRVYHKSNTNYELVQTSLMPLKKKVGTM